MQSDTPGLYGDDWESGPRLSRPVRRALAVIGVMLGLFFLSECAREVVKDRRRAQSIKTLVRIRELAATLEEAAVKAGGHYPCIRRHEDIPAAIVSALPPQTLTDGWGNPIVVLANRDGYLIRSMGSDGVPDRTFVNGPFREQRHKEDIIYSNGVHLQYPEGLTTLFSGRLPRIEDALRAVASCTSSSS